MTRRARRDGRAARRNEEREKREDEKGAIVSSSPQGMTSWSSSIKICFCKLIECIRPLLMKLMFLLLWNSQKSEGGR